MNNDADFAAIFSVSTPSSVTQSVRDLTLDTSGIGIKLSAKAGQALDGKIANTTNVVITTSATSGSTAATYDANANQLNIVIENGLTDAQLKTALIGSAAAALIDFDTSAGTGNTAAGDTGSYSTGSGIITPRPVRVISSEPRTRP